MTLAASPYSRAIVHPTAPTMDKKPRTDHVEKRREKLSTEDRPHYEIALRLIRAREEAGFVSAAEAARAMGIPKISYYHHENGRRKIPVEMIELYARTFGVSPSTLLFGIEATPGKTCVALIVGVVEDGGFVRATTEPRAVIIPDIGAPNPAGYEVRTKDLWPVYRVGDMGFFSLDDLRNPITPDLDDVECYLITTLGVTMIRHVLRVHRNGRMDLMAYKSGEEENVKINGAAPIRLIIRKQKI